MKKYSAVVSLMTALLTKNVQFEWNHKVEAEFQSVKKAFTLVPVFTHLDSGKPSVMECNTSDFVTSGIPPQSVNKILHPVAFVSKKMSPDECNYHIYNKESLAIVRCFEVWRLSSKEPYTR